jgi:hypothetical protein
MDYSTRPQITSDFDLMRTYTPTIGAFSERGRDISRMLTQRKRETLALAAWDAKADGEAERKQAAAQLAEREERIKGLLERINTLELAQVGADVSRREAAELRTQVTAAHRDVARLTYDMAALRQSREQTERALKNRITTLEARCAMFKGHAFGALYGMERGATLNVAYGPTGTPGVVRIESARLSSSEPQMATATGPVPTAPKPKHDVPVAHLQRLAEWHKDCRGKNPACSFVEHLREVAEKHEGPRTERVKSWLSLHLDSTCPKGKREWCSALAVAFRLGPNTIQATIEKYPETLEERDARATAVSPQLLYYADIKKWLREIEDARPMSYKPAAKSNDEQLRAWLRDERVAHRSCATGTGVCTLVDNLRRAIERWPGALADKTKAWLASHHSDSTICNGQWLTQVGTRKIRCRAILYFSDFVSQL